LPAEPAIAAEPQRGIKMAEAYRKYSTAKKNAEGQPVIRVSDLYISGVSEIDEISVIAPEGSITAHITMRHLDRLGNGNYAIAGQPIKENSYEPPTSDRVGLPMGIPEAMALWELLDRTLAGQSVEGNEKLRWTRDRLARILASRTEEQAVRS
jgi:hypothetical protein